MIINTVLFKKYLVLIFFSIFCTIASSQNLAPFTTDGCSAFTDGTTTQKELWLPCCIRHDFSYWQGGTAKKRVVADHELHQCIVNLGDSSIVRLMLLGVRIGGSPYFPSSFRWGYGWPFPRGYQHLSIKEKQQVVEQSKKIDLSLQQVIKAID